MEIEKLNSWLTLLANLGVLAGIVFLVIELDQSNRQAQSEAFQARINEIDQAGREYALSETLPAIYTKINERGYQSLTQEEKERVRSWEGSRAARMNGQLVQYQNGFLDENAYKEMIEVGTLILPLWEEMGRTESSVWSDLIQVLQEAASNNE